jgi:hypothetical protein
LFRELRLGDRPCNRAVTGVSLSVALEPANATGEEQRRCDAPIPCQPDPALHARPRAFATLAALAGAAVLIAGCDGRSSAAVLRSPGPLRQVALVPDEVAFTACMRSNGRPRFPDSNAGGGFDLNASLRLDPASSAFKAAQAKCNTHARQPRASSSSPTSDA